MGINSTVFVDYAGNVVDSSEEEVDVVKFEKGSSIFNCLKDMLEGEELEQLRTGFGYVVSGERRQFSVKKYIGGRKHLRVRAQRMKDSNIVSIAVRVGDEDIVEILGHHFRNPLFTISNMGRRITAESRYLEDILENILAYMDIKRGRYPVVSEEGFDLYKGVIVPALQHVSLEMTDVGMDPHHRYSIGADEVRYLSTNRNGLLFVYKQLFANAVSLGFRGARLSLGVEPEDSQFARLIMYSHTKNIIAPGEAEDMFRDWGVDIDDENPDPGSEALGVRLYNARKIIELQGGKMWAETGTDVTKDKNPYLKLYFTVKKIQAKPEEQKKAE